MSQEPVPVNPLEELPQLDYSPVERNRLTAVLAVHHEQSQEQPKSFNLNYVSMLTTDHEAYSRRCSCSEEWTALDWGWIPAADVGFLLIEALEGKGLQVHPTEEEKAESAKRVMEIGYVTSLQDAWPIPPAGFFFVPVERAKDLRIRCRHQATRYRIHVIPR